jgi:hypothetical protein
VRARYEVYPFPTRKERGLERYIMDDSSGLDPEVFPNGMVICGVGGFATDCGINKGRSKVVPRVGLAWRATDSTVLRAGYGMTVDPFNWARPLRTNYPVMEVFNINPSSFTIGGTLREGLPVIAEPDTSSGILPLPSNAAVTFFDNNNAVRGYIQSWNASVERRFGGWIGTASYVATRSNNQLAGLEQNWAPIAGGNAGRQLNTPAFDNRTVTTRLHGSLGTPKYDSLQTKLEHRFSNGFQTNFAYTWAHTRAFTGEDSGAGTRFFGIPSTYDRMYGPAGQDIRHNFQFMGIYETPFGRGKPYLSGGGVLGAILGGWQFNNLLSWYSGQPFTVDAPSGDLNAPGSGQLADCIAEPIKLGNQRDQGPMYDVSSFADPADFYGDTPRFGTCGINTLPGPGLFNLDVGLFRKFAITERVELQFRAEGFNITNTPHFSNPEGTVTSGDFMLVDGIRNTGREGIDQRFFRFGLRLGW